MKKSQYYSLIIIVLFLLSNNTHGQTKKEIEAIQKKSNIEVLNRLHIAYKNQFEEKKQKAIQFAIQNGLQRFIENEDGSFDELMEITKEGKPIYFSTQNVNAAKSSRANHLNTGGSLGLNLNGQAMTAYVWDGGPVRTSHQEYGSRVMVGDLVTTLNGNSYHSTHVTGTIAAKGVVSNAKGMANQSNVITNDWNNDLGEATNAAANGMLLSNHSYSSRSSSLPDWAFGAYSSYSRNWDQVMYNAPYYLMVKSAGNNGQRNYNSLPLNGNAMYDKLGPRANAKNGLVVAATYDANIATNGNLISVTLASFTSPGPTDDLRIKPDISGNGVRLYSTYDTSDNSYGSISGTSMATPSVTGSLLLLQQHYTNLNNSFMRAATLKGLTLHTADDINTTGPDAFSGWGLLNMKKAAEAISNKGVSSIIKELTLASGTTYTTTINSDGINPLMASISWTDPAGIANTGTANLTTPALVNDLDIRITKANTTYTPYRLTSVASNGKGDNRVDPFERIDVDNASGRYTLTVSHKGTLSSGNQQYSLIVTGILAEVDNCVNDLTITTPVLSNETDNQQASNTLTATNVIHNGATANYNAGVKIRLQPGFKATSGSSFRAFIEDCSNDASSLPQQNTREVVTYTTNITNQDKENLDTRNTLENVGFQMYPNPVKEFLNIKINTAILTDGSVQIYSINGALVQTHTLQKKDESDLKIDVSQLKKGIYIVKIINNKKDVFVKKIIKE